MPEPTLQERDDYVASNDALELAGDAHLALTKHHASI